MPKFVYGARNFEIRYHKCETSERFSRDPRFRKCGKVVDALEYKCNDVYKHVNYNYEGCHLWTFGTKWEYCDANIVLDPYPCSTLYQDSRWGCPDSLDEERRSQFPLPAPVTLDIEVDYHDFESESDKKYSESCTWSFN